MTTVETQGLAGQGRVDIRKSNRGVVSPGGPNMVTERVGLHQEVHPSTVGGATSNTRITGAVMALGELGTRQGEGGAVGGVVGVVGAPLRPPAELGALLHRGHAELQAQDMAGQAAGVGACR